MLSHLLLFTVVSHARSDHVSNITVSKETNPHLFGARGRRWDRVRTQRSFQFRQDRGVREPWLLTQRSDGTWSQLRERERKGGWGQGDALWVNAGSQLQLSEGVLISEGRGQVTSTCISSLWTWLTDKLWADCESHNECWNIWGNSGQWVDIKPAIMTVLRSKTCCQGWYMTYSVLTQTANTHFCVLYRCLIILVEI